MGVVGRLDHLLVSGTDSQCRLDYPGSAGLRVTRKLPVPAKRHKTGNMTDIDFFAVRAD
jgi:hypothetical protein